MSHEIKPKLDYNNDPVEPSIESEYNERSGIDRIIARALAWTALATMVTLCSAPITVPLVSRVAREHIDKKNLEISKRRWGIIRELEKYVDQSFSESHGYEGEIKTKIYRQQDWLVVDIQHLVPESIETRCTYHGINSDIIVPTCDNLDSITWKEEGREIFLLRNIPKLNGDWILQRLRLQMPKTTSLGFPNMPDPEEILNTVIGNFESQQK